MQEEILNSNQTNIAKEQNVMNSNNEKLNTLDHIFSQSERPRDYVKRYFKHLSDVLNRIDPIAVENFIDALIDCRENCRQIFFIGNGGSAATASHFANDIGIGTRTKKLPFKAISLTDNVAILTALGNDEGYDKIFTKQLELYLNPQDLVVAISASGNSSNIIDAIKFARAKDAKIVGLTGFDGGMLRELSHINIHIDTMKGEYGPVEDAHMIIDHLVGTYLSRFVQHEELKN